MYKEELAYIFEDTAMSHWTLTQQMLEQVEYMSHTHTHGVAFIPF